MEIAIEASNKIIKNEKKKKPKAKIIILLLILIISFSVFTVVFFSNPCRDGHTWKSATCENPKTCSACGKTDGYALGHKWEGGTCTTPGICSVCGKEGYTKPHDFLYGVCITCGKNEPFVSFSEEDGEDDYWFSVTAAQNLVKDELKAPSTAKFPISTDEYTVKKSIYESNWIVSGYVDSQNGFGAMIRTRWTATFTMSPTTGSKYRISNYKVTFP